MDLDECYQGAIHQVLHSLHLSQAALAESVRVVFNSETKSKHVEVLKDMDEGTLRLPPCSPSHLRLQKSSVHPQRVAVSVLRKSGLTFASETAATYYIQAPGGDSPRHPLHSHYTPAAQDAQEHPRDLPLRL